MPVKRVLYLSYDGLTDPLGQSQILPYLERLSSSEVQFTILSFEKRGSLNSLGKLIEEKCKASNIEWHPLIFHENPPIISKWYDRYLFKSSAIKLHKKNNFQLLHCRSYIASEIGLYFRKTFNVPFIFDMRGLWADEKKDSGHWNLHNPVYRRAYNHYKNLEKDFVSSAAHIISLTHAGKEELHKLYGKDLIGLEESLQSKCTVIPTCADLQTFDYNKIKEAEKVALRQSLNIPEKSKVLIYSGSLGTWYMLREMFNFFEEYKDYYPGSIFLILTKDKHILTRFIKDNYISEKNYRVAFAQKSELPLYLTLGNASVFFIRNSYSKIASSPTKHAELMGMGIPVFCNDIGDTGYYTRKYNLGVVVEPRSPASQKKAIGDFDEINFDREKIRQCAIENFDVKMGVERYKKVYDSVLIEEGQKIMA